MPTPDQRSHEQAQVERPRVDEQSLEDVGMPSQARRMPPVSYRCAFGRSWCSLGRRSKATPRVSAGCVGDSHRPASRGDGVLRPVASAAIRFRDAASQVEGCDGYRRLNSPARFGSRRIRFSMIENGQSGTSIRTTVAAASALNVSLDFLAGLSDDPEACPRAPGTS